MAQPTFCCNDIKPYPRFSRTDHDEKFNPFINVATENATKECNTPTASSSASNPSADEYPYIIQFVKQVSYGPVESRQFFAPASSTNISTPTPESKPYIELSEEALIAANFTKVNTYKNFKCTDHNRFFELNLYQKDPVNKHHWRLDIARPSKEIDL
jgi:hypothetical protein